MSHVEEAIRNWETQRAGVIEELENTSEEGLDYRPGEGARTLREIVVHVAESGVAITAEIVRPDGSLANLFDPERQARLRVTLPRAHSKAELLELLRETGARTASRLREAGDALATQTMPTLGGVETRLSAIWFGVSHEMYHRGQIAVYERGLGTVPALTQKITSMLAG